MSSEFKDSFFRSMPKLHLNYLKSTLGEIIINNDKINTIVYVRYKPESNTCGDLRTAKIRWTSWRSVFILEGLDSDYLRDLQVTKEKESGI